MSITIITSQEKAIICQKKVRKVKRVFLHGLLKKAGLFGDGGRADAAAVINHRNGILRGN